MTTEEKSKKAKTVLWIIGAIIGVLLSLLGKANLDKDQEDAVWFGLVLYFFAVLAWLDYTVVIVGPYWPDGLMLYWMSLATLYIALTFIVTWHEWMNSWKVKNTIRHGAVTFLFLVGALADWFFFCIQGYVNDLSMQWTWMWQHMVFGWWTGWAQLAWSLMIVGVIAVIWIKVRD